ncbi:hypothetical protein [Micromonospora sp. CPCC 206061]
MARMIRASNAWTSWRKRFDGLMITDVEDVNVEHTGGAVVVDDEPAGYQ